MLYCTDESATERKTVGLRDTVLSIVTMMRRGTQSAEIGGDAKCAVAQVLVQFDVRDVLSPCLSFSLQDLQRMVIAGDVHHSM